MTFHDVMMTTRKGSRQRNPSSAAITVPSIAVPSNGKLPRFGAFVRTLRESKGIPAAVLARAVGIDQSVWSKIEAGGRRAPEIVPFVQAIATNLGLDESSDDYQTLMQAAYQDRFGEKPNFLPGKNASRVPSVGAVAKTQIGLGGQFRTGMGRLYKRILRLANTELS